jgi:hypothetical protein
LWCLRASPARQTFLFAWPASLVSSRPTMLSALFVQKACLTPLHALGSASQATTICLWIFLKFLIFNHVCLMPG